MTWTEPAFEEVVRQLAAQTGLAFSAERRPAVEQGIRRAMAHARIDEPDRYVKQLAWDEDLFDDLVGELTIGETYFFREPGQFQFLRHTILPELRRCVDPPMVRAWSAGCASGEEPYSLAMVFAEEGLADRASVLATDISAAALVKARRAAYGHWSLRGEGAASALLHLNRRGERFLVKESIRRLVTFRPLNLALPVYPSAATGTLALNLIVCRNVLIYFDPATIHAVARRLFASLAPGGWLLTASSDPPLGEEAEFETIVTEQGVFHRRPIVLKERRRPGRSSPVDDPESCLRPEAPVTTPGYVPERTPDVPGLLGAARADLAEGRYARVAEQLGTQCDLVEAVVLRVRALANLDHMEAEKACREALATHPLSPELHHLRAVLLHELGRDDEAAQATRRLLYLDRTLAIAHFLLGAVLQRRGDHRGAWRSFRNARDLCTARPAGEILPLSDGEPAGRLAEAAALLMRQLESGRRPTPVEDAP
jgi:chemotaxis protein methyltransferase CheR